MAAEQTQARAARPDEAEQALSVVCAAFGIDRDAARPLFYKDPFFDLSHKRVLFDADGAMVSCLTVVPSSLFVGEIPLPLGGVAGVATRPERQGRGRASRLLAATVGALWDELGYAVSALFPLSPPYYRRFAWETASRAVRWAGAPADLPQYSEADRVCPTQTPEVRQAIRRVHEASARGRTGACVRDARRWRVIEDMSPGRESAIYEGHGGAVEGYVLFERRQDSEAGETLHVQEMHGLTPEARRGLVGWLARQSATALQWPAGAPDLGRFGLWDAPGRMTPESGMMLRICDLPAAVTLLHAVQFAAVLGEERRTLTLRAADDIRPENRRPVRLTPGGVELGTDADRDWIAADIRLFAQFFTGYRTPVEAASLGLLSASASDALALADRLFPARQPYVAPADQF